ncbi:MAG: hypothetical protein QOG76_2696, partial [Pseudonocardiales bacterium]|nr:hypothetical protein [Pseudonocardiales bacterium]
SVTATITPITIRFIPGYPFRLITVACCELCC